MKFPMILTHRDNAHAQIVVANAEQLAQVPEEYLPPATTPTVTAAAAVPGVNLSTDLVDLEAQRAEFSRTVDEFTAHVQSETEELAAIRTQIDADRAELDGLRAQLEQDRAAFEAQKAAALAPQTGETAGDDSAVQATAQGAATGDSDAAAAAGKRTTKAKA